MIDYQYIAEMLDFLHKKEGCRPLFFKFGYYFEYYIF